MRSGVQVGPERSEGVGSQLGSHGPISVEDPTVARPQNPERCGRRNRVGWVELNLLVRPVFLTHRGHPGREGTRDGREIVLDR